MENNKSKIRFYVFHAEMSVMHKVSHLKKPKSIFVILLLQLCERLVGVEVRHAIVRHGVKSSEYTFSRQYCTRHFLLVSVALNHTFCILNLELITSRAGLHRKGTFNVPFTWLSTSSANQWKIEGGWLPTQFGRQRGREVHLVSLNMNENWTRGHWAIKMWGKEVL